MDITTPSMMFLVFEIHRLLLLFSASFPLIGSTVISQ